MKTLLAAALMLVSFSANASAYDHDRVINTGASSDIVISTSKRTLTYAGETFKVAVGKPSAQWSGVQYVTRKAEWPGWTPTPNMRKRKKLPVYVPGGPKNPLGARALYLGSTLYRIHGTNDPKSIGRSASSGCFRMHNKDVIRLYNMVPVGTRVIVKG